VPPGSPSSSPQAARLEAARSLVSSGQFAQAKALLLPLLQRSPRDVEALKLLALTLGQLREFDQAEHYTRRLIELEPSNPRLWLLLANIAQGAGKPAEARAALARALPLAQSMPRVLLEAGWMLFRQHDYAGASAAAGRAAELAPTDADAHYLHGAGLHALGRVESASAAYAQALLLRPDDPSALHAAASVLNYAPDADPRSTLAAHQRFAAGLVAKAGPAAGPARGVPPADALAPRPLRVGILSPDLFRHSVAYFVRPLLRGIDRRAIELFVYSTTATHDDLHDELRTLLPERWRAFPPSGPGADPALIAAAVKADGLDVLIELSGLSHNHQLAVMVRKPAPLQLSYLGYPHSTGLPQIDGRIVDRLTDPPGAELAAERLLRLDWCFLCYTPPSDAPPVSQRGDGPVVFGSCNTLMKLNDATLRLWACVLAAVPGSRLLIKANWMQTDAVVADVQVRVRAAGLDLTRVEIVRAVADRREHLAVYQRIDIALDPFPYHGTTTTCEALHMGVPVVSRVGPAHAGRVGRSLLSAVGLGELAVDSDDAFVAAAAGLAGDAERMRGLRASLRATLAASPLCDEAGFCRRFEKLILGAWAEFARGAFHAPSPPGV